MKLIVKNNWNDISIKEYMDIQLCEDDLELYEILTNLESLEGVTEEDKGWIKQQFNFLFEKPTFKYQDKIIIGGELYNVVSEFDKITTAQFIDLQMYLKQPYDSLHKILSILVIPNKHLYNEGYDINKLQEDILNELNVEYAFGIFELFNNNLKDIIENFKGLFGDNDEVEGEDSESNINNQNDFNHRWGWFYLAEQVSKVKSCTLDNIFDLNVIQFLNLCSYLKEKNQYEANRIDEYKKK